MLIFVLFMSTGVLFWRCFFPVSIFKREITYKSTKVMEKHIWRFSLLVKLKTSTDYNMNFSYIYAFYIHFRNVYFKEHPWIAASVIQSIKKNILFRSQEPKEHLNKRHKVLNMFWIMRPLKRKRKDLQIKAKDTEQTK